MREPVAVLCGGDSAERDISLRSGEAVLQALEQLKVEAMAVDTRIPLKDWLDADMGCAFIALHGASGEDGGIQGALEVARVPYTGSGVLASALAMDKWQCRKLLRQAGLPVPKSQFFRAGEPVVLTEDLGEMLFVKPNAQGSSLGCSRVGGNHGKLEEAVQLALEYDDAVLVETWLDGAEYAVGVLGDRILPPVRIEPDGPFYDYHAKYVSDKTRYHLPCGLSAARERQAQQIALEAWQTIGGAGWGRVDLREQDEDFLVVEINTVPGLTRRSLVPMAAAHLGLDFPGLIREILALANGGAER